MRKRLKLRPRTIEAAKPGPKPYEIHDADLKGLLVRIQPTGIRSFVVQWGRGKRTTLKGHYPVLTLEAARTQALAILRDARENGTPAMHQPKRSRNGVPDEVRTFSEFIDKRYGPWAIEEQKAGAATVANLRAQFAPLFGSKPLADITAWSVEKFKASRLKAGIKPVTVNRDLDRIRAALNKAVEWRLLSANPVSSVKRSKGGDSSRARYLTDAEEKRLRKALQDREAERRSRRASGNAWASKRGHDERVAWGAHEFTDHLAPLVLVAMNTGLRRGELLGLTWKCVSFEHKQLTVAASTAKSGKVRHVPLNTEAFDVLVQWRRQRDDSDALVFPGASGSPMTHINRSWGSLAKAAQLHDFHFHDCRHHFASRLVMSGVDLYTVQQLLGHSDFAMTQRYAHLSPQHKAAAVEKLVAAR